MPSGRWPLPVPYPDRNGRRRSALEESLDFGRESPPDRRPYHPLQVVRVLLYQLPERPASIASEVEGAARIALGPQRAVTSAGPVGALRVGTLHGHGRFLRSVPLCVVGGSHERIPKHGPRRIDFDHALQIAPGVGVVLACKRVISRADDLRVGVRVDL